MWFKAITFSAKLTFLLILPLLISKLISTGQAAEKKAWWETGIQSYQVDTSSQTKITGKGSTSLKPVFNLPSSITTPTAIINRTTKIFFVSYRDGNSDIYVMNADGTGQRRITDTPSAEWGLAVSADGTKIAFYYEGSSAPSGIYVMNTDGTGLRNLTSQKDYSPAWSYDGTRIAFIREQDGRAIYIMNSDGTEQRILTNAVYPSGISWSPDGWIAFTRMRDDHSVDIYVMNEDGTVQRTLTNTPSDDEVSPVFSPDGSKIAFSKSHNLGDFQHGDSQVYVMNADGTDPRNLTNNSVWDDFPSWSR